jgi:hypothetical protein
MMRMTKFNPDANPTRPSPKHDRPPTHEAQRMPEMINPITIWAILMMPLLVERYPVLTLAILIRVES